MLRIAAILAAALVVASSAAASRPAHRDPSAMTALVAEWSVVPSEGVVAAGPVRIRVRNVGLEPHELVLTRTARFSQSLKLDGDRAIASPVGEPVLVQPGQTRTVTFHVRAGSYVLLDNLPWHYWQGAWAAFAVR
jgi:uncharacterized cupredoxin-like copper-binding protein